MERYAYVLYNRRSSVTGRALFEALRAIRAGGYVWRHSASGSFRQTPSLILRWGNAMRLTGDFIEINGRDEVRLASEKRAMMQKLVDTEDVPTPRMSTTNTRDLSDNGMAYIRDAHNVVRYGNTILGTDRYALQPIEKTHEYRVQIFDGKTVGVYEKVPMTPGNPPRLYKNHNCNFVRLDQSNGTLMGRIRGVRPAAVAAANAIGLLFSGVDVMVAPNGVFVNEVNSAPALNTPNLSRLATLFDRHIASLSDETAQTASAAEEARIAEGIRQEELRAAEDARLAVIEAARVRREGELRDYVSRFIQTSGYSRTELLDELTRQAS